MIDENVADEWPKELKEQLTELDQGHVIFGLPPIGYYARKSTAATETATLYDGDPDSVEFMESTLTPDAWIVLTQSCDICEEGVGRKPLRPFLKAAPVFRVELGDVSKYEVGTVGVVYLALLTAERFVEERWSWVVDLRYSQDFDKGLIIGTTRARGFANTDEARRFGRQLAYLSVRPAYDQAIVENVLDPFRAWFRKSEDRRQAVVDSNVREFRLQVNGPPWTATLIVVMEEEHDRERVSAAISPLFYSILEKCRKAEVDIQEPVFSSLTLLSARQYETSDRIMFDWLRTRGGWVRPESDEVA